MTRGLRTRIILPVLLALALLGCTSCIYVDGFDSLARYEEGVPLAAPLEPGSSFTAQTRDGSITIEGAQTDECSLQATIVTRAMTMERAEELASQIEVRLEPAPQGLRVVIDRPAAIRNAWFSVSLQGSVPEQTDLMLSTSDGAIHIANITGTVEARTADGSIEAQDLGGDTKFKTADGRIACTRLKARAFECHTSDGSIQLSDVAVASLIASTSDGSIHIEYAPAAPKAVKLNARTSDGSITLVTPPDVSAQIDAGTNDGSIRTDLPITIRGKVGKSLNGTIDGGEGRIYLRTGDGSITIR